MNERSKKRIETLVPSVSPQGQHIGWENLKLSITSEAEICEYRSLARCGPKPNDLEWGLHASAGAEPFDEAGDEHYQFVRLDRLDDMHSKTGGQRFRPILRAPIAVSAMAGIRADGATPRSASSARTFSSAW